MKKNIFVILLSLYALSNGIAATAIVAKDIFLPIVKNGKTIGNMTVKAGEEVQVIQIFPNEVVIQRGEMAPTKVSSDCITPDSLVIAGATLSAPKVDEISQKANPQDLSGHTLKDDSVTSLQNNQNGWVNQMPTTLPNQPNFTNQITPSTSQSDQISGESLLSTNFWNNPKITWNVVKSLGSQKIYSTRTPLVIFGVSSEEIRITTETQSNTESIQEIEVVLASLSNTMQTGVNDPNTPEATKGSDLQRLIGQWPSIYQAKRLNVEQNLKNQFGRFVEKSEIISPSLRQIKEEYQAPGFSIDLLTSDSSLLEITIQRGSEIVSTTSDPKNRAEMYRDKVQRNDQDDKFIDVPLIDLGPQENCSVGILAMLARYYGSQADMSEFSPRNDNWNEIINTLATACQLDADGTDKPITFEIIRKNIDQGAPIIVSRWAGANHIGGHTSLITGYNSNTREVLLTECFGKGGKTHPMRLDELLKGLWAYYTFQISEIKK